MHPLIESLLAKGLVVTDGAWGTQLQALGLASGDCPDHWNLTHPDRVSQVPRAYVEAGSQIVLTNTFRANRLALDGYGLADQVQAINRAGGEISLQAAAGRAAVFASIGPSGKMLMAGQVTEQELLDCFSEQAAALASSGVQALVIETMADLSEAKIALQAATATGLPVVVCLIYDSGKKKDRTMMGNSAEQAARELTEAGADVIGANCGQGIESYVEVCRQLHAATTLPIWIKANAGIPEVDGDRVVYRTGAADFASSAPALVDAGARFIGGCCGTGPAFIAALVERLKS